MVRSLISRFNRSVNSFSSAINNLPSTRALSNTTNNLPSASALSNLTGGRVGQISPASFNTFSTQLNAASRNLNGFAAEATRNLQNVTGTLSGLQNDINSSLNSFNNIGQNFNVNLPNFNVNLDVPLSALNNAGNVINRVSSAANLLGDLSSNPNRIQNVLKTKINSLVGARLAPLTGAISSLSNLGSSLANSVSTFNPLTVITRNINDLESAVGGIFDTASAAIRNAENFSDLLPNLGNSFEDPWAELRYDAEGEFTGLGSGGVTRHRNVLRNFNHYSYIITFGVLKKNEVNNPFGVREAGGFSSVIFRSGGGAYDKRTRIYAEGSEDAEYFVDNLELNAVIGPNPNTGMATGTSIKFEVIEPHSMGNFLEALMVSAEENGYGNYIETPYGLSVEFVGWDEYGENPITPANPMYVPITINNMDFDVTERGSVYAIEATTFDGIASYDQITQSNTDIQASGSLVYQALQSSRDSVTNGYNSRIEALEDNQIINPYDRYVIAFPSDPNGVMNAILSNNVDISAAFIPAAEQEGGRLGLQEGIAEIDDPDRENVEVQIRSGTSSQLYTLLSAYAQSTSQMNPIGKSSIISDTREGSDHPHPEADSVYDDAILRSVRRNAGGLSPAEKSRNFTWPQGTKITKMIEDVILASEYSRENATEDSQNGFKQGFRIETYTFIEDSDFSETEQQMGRNRRVYVYAIHPYAYSEDITNPPTIPPRNLQSIRNSAAKEYDYLYSGKNEDILNFDINFNNAFFTTALADFGQTRTDVGSEIAATSDNTSVVPGQYQPNRIGQTLEGTAIQGQANSLIGYQGQSIRRSLTSDAKRNIAIQLYDRLLNSTVDMITARMEIWGDPYYLPTVNGNYSSPPAGVNISQDDTMLYLRDQVFIILNFTTPLDYEPDGTMYFQRSIKSFSGIFQVLGSTNIFSGGEFRQILDLRRVNGQNLNQTSGARGFVEEGTPEQTLNTPVTPSVEIGYGVGQVDPALARAAGLANTPVVPSASGDAFTPTSGVFGDNEVGSPSSISAADRTYSYDEFGNVITQGEAEAAVGLDAFGGPGTSVSDAAQRRIESLTSTTDGYQYSEAYLRRRRRQASLPDSVNRRQFDPRGRDQIPSPTGLPTRPRPSGPGGNGGV